MTPMIVNPRVGSRIISGKTVAFNCQNHLLAIWNPAAGSVWDGFRKGESIESLARQLAPSWGVNPEEAISSINEFTSELVADGFILDDEVLKCPNEAIAADQGGENTLLAVEMMAIKSLTPYAVTFETTYDCNLYCVHCFMDRDKPSLGFEEIVNILDQLANAGTLFVSFTGGEFFARKDALDIIDVAHKRLFIIDILSNGTLIDERIASFLGQRNVRRVQLSFYGCCACTHDSITRILGSFMRTTEGLHALLEAGVKVEIAFPMMSQNFAERYEVWNMAKAFGCLISPSPIITARNNGSTDTHALRISDEQFRDFYADKELSALYSGRKPFSDHQLYLGFSDILDAAPCYSGFNTCAITPEGKVYPCNQLLYEVGDLRKNSFAEIWHDSKELQKLRSYTIRDLPVCGKCPLLSSCSRCPGLALLEGDNLLDCSPENCRQTRIFSGQQEVKYETKD